MSNYPDAAPFSTKYDRAADIEQLRLRQQREARRSVAPKPAEPEQGEDAIKAEMERRIAARLARGRKPGSGGPG